VTEIQFPPPKKQYRCEQGHIVTMDPFTTSFEFARFDDPRCNYRVVVCPLCLKDVLSKIAAVEYP
jgi:hypothetical protein